MQLKHYLVDNDSILRRLGRILTGDLDEMTLSPCKVVTLADVLTSLTTTMGTKRKRDYDKRKQDLIDREAKGRTGIAPHKLILSSASSKPLSIDTTSLYTYTDLLHAMGTYSKPMILNLLVETYGVVAGIVPQELGLDKTLRACLAFHDKHSPDDRDMKWERGLLHQQHFPVPASQT